MSLAKRVSEEMDVPLGSTVGYSVRFEEAAGPETCIKFVTDGMLLRELLADRSLSRYSVVIVDEAHERTLRTDVLFGVLKRLQTQRKHPLKIVVMSATLDPQKFLHFFPNSAAYSIEGRQHPVRLFYTLEPQQDYLDSAVLSIFQIQLEKGPGDILVFLTGQEEIEAVEQLLLEHSSQCPPGSPRMLVCPLFASLPAHQQMRIFKPTPPGCRKIVLSTNIAETSITIPGIRYVIDPGFVKMRQYSPRTGMEALVVRPVSKSSCRQRAGRAGRLAEGECFRLFPEDAFKHLDDETPPEIMRTNLSNVVLTMKAWGVDDVLGFDFLDHPPLDSLEKGLAELLALGALEAGCGTLTQTGRLMADCPLGPQLARVLIEAKKLECTEEILTIVSMLSADAIFLSRGDRDHLAAARRIFFHSSGDHMTLLNVHSAFLANKSSPRWCRENCIDLRAMKHAVNVRRQLCQFCERHDIPIKSCGEDPLVVLKCLCAGYFLQCALKQPDGSLQSVVGRQIVHVHPTSVLHGSRPECVIYHELTLTSKCYLRCCSVVQPGWIASYSSSSSSSSSNRGML